MEAFLWIGALIVLGAFASGFFSQSKSNSTPTPKGQHGNAAKPKRRTPARRTAEQDMKSNHVFSGVRGSSSVDDDDGLATFSMGRTSSETPSSNTTPGRWVRPGEAITVAGHTITGGFFYFGGKLSSVERYGRESSLIDDSLEVKDLHLNYSDATLGYWPTYDSISPQCRGAYLTWLASDRSSATAPLGYVFLYFYGLERRIVHDSKKKDEVSDEEFSDIVKEIRRLISEYGRNPTFKSYAYRLLEWMKLLRPSLVTITNDEIIDNNLRLLFSILAGKLVRDGQKIPAAMAYIWLSFTDFIPKTPARRCQAEFKKLFMILYQGMYGEGMTIKPNKTMVEPYYRPASSTLPQITLKATQVPNPVVLGSVASKLIYLANTASHRLDPYSRYLGKNGKSPDDLEALLLLPEELCKDADSGVGFTKFRQWAEKEIENNQGLVTFEELWYQLGCVPIDKLSKKNLELAQMGLDRIGLGMAPDTRFHHAKPSLMGPVVLFHGGHGDMVEPSSTFNEIGMSLRLGAMVAQIDGHAHDAEVAVLKGLIDHNDNLSESAKTSLHAYLIWRLNTPSNNVSLKKQIEALSDSAKHGISKLMIRVALADGKISPDEIKQMEKLYTSLGLDKTLVTSDIHGLTTTHASDIPKGGKPSEASGGFRLDDTILARHESETKDVQGILGSIFTEDELEETVEDIEAPAEDVPDEDEDGLDSAHRKLMETLLTREKWERSEFESLSEGLGLMADGALETINDWSFDQVDAPLLEDDDDIYVMLDIAEEIANQ